MEDWISYKSTFLPNTAVSFDTGNKSIHVILCFQGQPVIYKYNRNNPSFGEDSNIEMKVIEYNGMDDKIIYIKYIERRNLRLS